MNKKYLVEFHRMNPLHRFSNVAESYAQYRPDYPTEAIDAILAPLGDLSEKVAIDIGAGTGISARLLAERGINVIAIEPNVEMKQAAQAHPKVEWRDGVAEKTGLADGSVDLVTSFQAFHWFDPEPTLKELSRILKPGGWLAITWNQRDCSDRFTSAYHELLRIASNGHPAQRRTSSEMVEPLRHYPYFTYPNCQSFPYQQKLDLTGMIALSDSYSYVPAGPAQEQLAKDLEQLCQQWGDDSGCVNVVYRTDVYQAGLRLGDF